MLKNKLIKLLLDAKSKINKSEVRAIVAIEKAIEQLKRLPDNVLNDRNSAITLLVIFHEVLKHLPSIEAMIRLFHSS